MKAIVNEEAPTKAECNSRVRNITDALYVLNGKWKFPLIFTIRERPMRFNEILKEMEGITPKVLAKELRDLEMHGFIVRNVHSTMPVNIIYEATTYSETLKKVLFELGQWGAQHREKVIESMREQQPEEVG